MRKKSQIKTTETTIVLIVFMFLLAFGLIYFGRIYYGHLMGKRAESEELHAKNLMLQMQFLSEFQCTKEESSESDCLDILKLLEFSKLYEQNKNYYSSHFQRVKIDAHQVFPEIIGHSGWNIVSADREGATGGEKFHIPITLYNSTHDIYTFGYLDIEVFK
jgi:hypothetical protein